MWRLPIQELCWQDLVIPVFKPDHALGTTPLLGDAARERKRLAFFRGDMGEGARLPNYSRGLRQRIHAAARKHDWATVHSVYVGTRWDTAGDYSEMLSTSKFCLVLPGVVNLLVTCPGSGSPKLLE